MMRTDDRRVDLASTHRAVEQALAAELARPLPDSLVVQRLKKTKLRLKDRLATRHAAMRPA